ncbi:MAG: hypothetical protein COB02_04530 [Candidatus Cloacimonadota bacterium]|nr:MAG: hypothetical protein COB02_04530 [Candidatus Cloacimonadota bacterium]
MKLIPVIIIVVVLLFSTLGFFSGLVYISPSKLGVITAKFGSSKAPGKVLASEGEIGIRENILGAGYHWIAPFMYEVKRYPVVVVPANKIGVITAKFGKKIKGDRYLALENEIGIRKRVLGPGTYRLNPFGYTISLENQTYISAGNVGVLINSQKGGVEQNKVLPAGIHFINPKEYKVEIVPIGLNEYTLSSKKVVRITDAMLRDEESPVEYSNKNIITGGEMLFPSKDGFNAGIDVTVLWELDPKRAISAVTKYGNVTELHDRVINPMLNSAARNEGSKYTAKALIQGDTRTKFQETFTKTLSEYTKNAPLKIVAALPRKIYVPVKIQLPIMQAQLKQEEMLTNREIEETSKIEAKLEEQKKYVKQEIEQVKADTKVLVLSIRAETEKEVGEYEAATRLQTLRIDLETQKIKTRIIDILSTAKADVIRIRGQKEAEVKKLYIDAFGGVEHYNSYIFATEALPKDKLPIQIIHSGEGTFWTDLKMTDKSQLKILSDFNRIKKAMQLRK